MQVTEGLVIDAALALSKAGAAGLALGELAHVLWPDAGVRANGACGSVVAELQRRGVASITPGGKRRRIALTDAGRTWIETSAVIADAAGAAELLDSYTTSRLAPDVASIASAPPPPPAREDPVEVAIQALVAPPPIRLPPGTSATEAYERGRAWARIHTRRQQEELREACGDEATYQLAMAEVDRRTQVRKAEIEAFMATNGIVDPGQQAPAY